MRKRKPSDTNPRCTVCRKKLASGDVKRCATCPQAYTKPDYDKFLATPIPEGGATHAEIGAAIGISAERVRQIEAVALRKLGLDPRAFELFRGE